MSSLVSSSLHLGLRRLESLGVESGMKCFMADLTVRCSQSTSPTLSLA
jgi:hypothetical protein